MKMAESMILNPITFRRRFCCSIRFVKPIPNRMTAVTAYRFWMISDSISLLLSQISPRENRA